jgi:hypothetical protein
MEARDFRRPWLRLSVSVPLLLACSLCALAALSAGRGTRKVELMSAIDEYLQGKYGTGDSQSLGQLNDFDTAGYAGTQSVAKEFGLSENNPLVQQWDQDQTLSTLNENPLQDLRAESAPARAAAITQSVFGSPPAPASAMAPTSAIQDEDMNQMQARGAKAVQSQSIAAERKQMREQMLQKFEAAAEAPTKKVAAQAADTIGDGTVPSDSSYMLIPTVAAAASGVPALASAKPAVKPAVKVSASPAHAENGGCGPGELLCGSGVKSSVKINVKSRKVQAIARVAKKAAKAAAAPKPKALVIKSPTHAAPSSKMATSPEKARLRSQIKALKKKVHQEGKHQQLAKATAAGAPEPTQSWSGLADMLSTRTSAERKAAREQKRLLSQESSTLSRYNPLSDPEDDLHVEQSSDGRTDAASFGSLLTTLKKDEDPEAAAKESMYRDAEQAAVNNLHPVQEVYTSTPEEMHEQPALRQEPNQHLLKLSTKLTAVEKENEETALKLQLLHAQVKRLKEQRQVQKLEDEVAQLKEPKRLERPLTSLAATRQAKQSQEAKYLAEDEKEMLISQHHSSSSSSSSSSSPALASNVMQVSQQKSVLAADAAAKFEEAREHVAVKEADTSEEDVARLRAEVEVMRDRINTLEKHGHANAGNGAQMAEDPAVRSALQLKGKARQQLLQQLRRGALEAGKGSQDFWQRRKAKLVAAKYKAEALDAGAKSYDQVAPLFFACLHPTAASMPCSVRVCVCVFTFVCTFDTHTHTHTHTHNTHTHTHTHTHTRTLSRCKSSRWRWRAKSA